MLFGGQIRQRLLALPLGELAAVRLTERELQRRQQHLSHCVALSVCPFRGSQLPHRGSQGVRRFRYAKQQFVFENRFDNWVEIG